METAKSPEILIKKCVIRLCHETEDGTLFPKLTPNIMFYINEIMYQLGSWGLEAAPVLEICSSLDMLSCDQTSYTI